MITREKLKKLNKENLIELILEMSELLNENQNRKCNQIVAGYLTDQSVNSHDGVQARMSDEFVSEKMAQIKIWIQQIDEGELYLNADEYEDYSSGYWDSDLITEYYADWKCTDDPLVAALHRFCIVLIKRASLLIDQDSVLM